MIRILISATLGAGLGTAVLGFYSLLKFRGGALENPAVYKGPTRPINYMGAVEFISTPGRRWSNYLLFRTVPFCTALLLLIGILQAQANPQLQEYLAGIVACYLVVVTPNLRELLDNERFLLVRVFSCCVALWLGLVACAAFLIGSGFDLSWAAPNFSSIRDNLWSAILASIIVVAYFRLTNLSPRPSRDPRTGSPQLEVQNFIKWKSQKIDQKYGLIIDSASDRTGVDRGLMLSILILEDLNRPAFVRILENMIVRITHLPLTVGVAQVRSNRPLSAEQSINAMADYIVESAYITYAQRQECELRDIIRAYNDSEEYERDIMEIYSIVA